MPTPGLSFQLAIVRPAAKAIANALSEGVSAAVVEFITGDLLREPRRVGKPLRRELEGRWAAGGGSYRVLYTIDEQAGVVTILAAEHRRDVDQSVGAAARGAKHMLAASPAPTPPPARTALASPSVRMRAGPTVATAGPVSPLRATSLPRG